MDEEDDRKRFWNRRNPFYDMFSEFDRMDEMMDTIMKKAFTDFDSMKSGKPMSYGFSMKIGPDGRPQINEFGNMLPGGEKIEVRDQRAPLVDVINHPSEFDILAELPGVEKDNIDIHATESKLTINVPGKFRKEVLLKEKIDADNVKSTYKNGVLTVTLKKKVPKKEEGKKVEVD